MLLAGFAAQRDDVATTKQERTLRRAVTGRVDDIDEVLTNAAIYLQEQLSVTPGLKITAGLRYNHLDYALEDNILAEGSYVSDYDTTRLNSNLGVALQPFGRENVLIYAAQATACDHRLPVRK